MPVNVIASCRKACVKKTMVKWFVMGSKMLYWGRSLDGAYHRKLE